MAEIRDDEFKGQPTMLGDMVVYPQPLPHHDPDSVRTERENGPHTEAGNPLTPESVPESRSGVVCRPTEGET